MALKLFPRVLDFGLNVFDTETDRMLICSSEPTTYSLATVNALGSYSVSPGALFGSPADYTNGRKITSLPIVGGSITTGGTPACWAAVDSANGRLHATGPMSAFGNVSSGQSWTLGAFTIDLPWSGLIPPWYLAASTIDLSFSTDRYYEEQSDVAHLYLKGEGTDASTSIIDSTGRHTVTANNGAQIDTAQFKFGASSILFSGTITYLSINGNSNDFTFGTGDLTIDFWLRMSSVSDFYGIIDFRGSSNTSPNPLIYFIQTDNKLHYNPDGTDRIISDSTIAVNTWYHIALTRSSGTTRMFINGTVQSTTYSDSLNYVAATTPYIGALTGAVNGFPGWIDSFRVVKGTAITPPVGGPTAPYRVPLQGPYNHLSISRASTGYAQTVAGVLTSFASNELRITDKGLLVEDARTNLIVQSQDFSTGWTANGSSVTTNSATAPDGTTTADTLTATSGTSADGNTHRFASSTFTADTYYANSVYLKSDGTNTWMFLMVTDGVANTYRTYFNLSGAGSVGDASTAGDGAFLSNSIEALANGWYRVIMVGKFTAARNGDFSIKGPYTADLDNTPTIGGFLYAWGAQCELGSFASSYIPTTTTSATRAADAVTCIGSVNTFLGALPQSLMADVDLDATNVDNIRVVGDSSGNTSLLHMNNATNSVGIYDGSTVLSATIGNSLLFTSGVKVASSQDSSGRSLVGGGGTVTTDSNKLAISNARLGYGSSATEKWYGYFRRVTAWGKKIADATLDSYTDPATTLAFPVDADTKVDLNFAGGQYFAMPLVTDYLSCSRASTGYGQTVAGTLTSFAINTLRVTDKGLLVEDARTNTIQRSQQIGVSPWILNDDPTVTFSADATTAPDGTMTADKMIQGTTAGTQKQIRSNQFYSVPGTYTVSCYLKAAETSSVDMMLIDNAGGTARYLYTLSGGGSASFRSGSGLTGVSASIKALANGWYRAVLTGTTAAGSPNMFLYINDTSGGVAFTGNGVNGFYLWGAQAESASFASSYIPTTTTSATRAADNITTIGNAQALIAMATGSIVGQVDNGLVAGVAANVVDSNGTNVLGFNSSNNALASLVATLATGNTANRTTQDKLGLGWDGSGRGLVLNGGTVVTDASAQTPSSTQHIGSSGTANFIYAYVERLTLWATKLANATLQGFTNP